MKKFTALALLALICVAAGCKEDTVGDNVDKAIDKVGDKAEDMKDALKK